MLLQAAAPALPTIDTRAFFIVNLVVVVSVVVFTAAVIVALLRRSYRRRVEEEKLAAIGIATARILHQIKNPLQTIVLHADLLLEPSIVSQEEPRREVCDAIVSESQRLVAMLDELSVYASGAQRQLSCEPIALHALVGQVAVKEVREASGSGLRVDAAHIAEATVSGDVYYLHQVLDNLVRNAREAMEGQAHRRLALSVQRVGPMAAVRVEDNGTGISPERLERIFQPFVSTKGKGMGLGLAICKEIVEGHGGRLEVESREGEGTAFTILLPLHVETTTSGPVEGREAVAWS